MISPLQDLAIRGFATLVFVVLRCLCVRLGVWIFRLGGLGRWDLGGKVQVQAGQGSLFTLTTESLDFSFSFLCNGMQSGRGRARARGELVTACTKGDVHIVRDEGEKLSEGPLAGWLA